MKIQKCRYKNSFKKGGSYFLVIEISNEIYGKKEITYGKSKRKIFYAKYLW